VFKINATCAVGAISPQIYQNPFKNAMQKIRAGMKVLKTIRLRGGKARAFMMFGDFGWVGLKQVET